MRCWTSIRTGRNAGARPSQDQIALSDIVDLPQHATPALLPPARDLLQQCPWKIEGRWSGRNVLWVQPHVDDAVGPFGMVEHVGEACFAQSPRDGATQAALPIDEIAWDIRIGPLPSTGSNCDGVSTLNSDKSAAARPRSGGASLLPSGRATVRDGCHYAGKRTSSKRRLACQRAEQREFLLDERCVDPPPRERAKSRAARSHDLRQPDRRDRPPMLLRATPGPSIDVVESGSKIGAVRLEPRVGETHVQAAALRNDDAERIA
jgi:hypothetical protein